MLYEQDGFVTSWQAVASGCPQPALSMLVREGRLQRVRRGVYRSTWGTPVMPRVDEELYADYLALDGRRLPWSEDPPTVVASHATAAERLHIGTIPADLHEFTSPVRRETTLAAVRLRVAPLEAGDWEWLDGRRIPVTSAARTIVDLALTGAGADYVARMVVDARNRRLTTTPELVATLDRRQSSAKLVSIDWLRPMLEAQS